MVARQAPKPPQLGTERHRVVQQGVQLGRRQIHGAQLWGCSFFLLLFFFFFFFFLGGGGQDNNVDADIVT
jgi:hypothetical protein